MPLGHAVDERVVAACARDRRAVERRLLALTALGGIAAARMEQATARPIELARHDAGDRRQALGGSPLRQGGQQGGRVGVVWIREEACDRLLFHLLPGILHQDRKSTRLTSSHYCAYRMPSPA